MAIQKLVNVIKKTENGNDIEFLNKVYNFADKAHQGQTRLTGEPYVEHPLRTAITLVKLNMDDKTVAAALLHDTVSKTKNVTLEHIRKEFGEEIAMLVQGVTQMGTLKDLSKEERQADMVRKVLLASVKDIRVVIIKLAERVDNMETIDVLSEDRRKRVAQDVMDIYAPIAHKLGIAKIKWKLEDLAFRQLYPEAYKDILERLETSHEEREIEVNRIMREIKESLDKNNYTYNLAGRPKHIYSIHKKMIRKKQTFEDIYDLRALRIITNTVGACYEILGIIHNLWRPIAREFDDYIANPKSNLYQSLHTVVIGPTHKPVEIQIRTEEMHKVAEEGIAAHWKYKGIKSEGEMDKKIGWMKELSDWQKRSTDAQEFMKILKIDFFEDQIFTFTPMGRVIEIPKDSTVLDFAFAVHSEVGIKATGGKVNGKFVALRTTLRTGDLVEVITSKTQTPSRDWLKFVKTSKARTKIKQHIRSIGDIPVKSILPEVEKKQELEAWIIKVENMSNPEIKLARCCKPLPGNKIIGYSTKTEKVSVHKKECELTEKYEGGTRRKKVPVSWIEDLETNVVIHVHAEDRTGVFAEILNSLLAIKIQIKNAKAKAIDMGSVECSFLMEVHGIPELQETIERIKKIQSVKQVYISESK